VHGVFRCENGGFEAGAGAVMAIASRCRCKYVLLLRFGMCACIHYENLVENDVVAEIVVAANGVA